MRSVAWVVLISKAQRVDGPRRGKGTPLVPFCLHGRNLGQKSGYPRHAAGMIKIEMGAQIQFNSIQSNGAVYQPLRATTIM